MKQFTPGILKSTKGTAWLWVSAAPSAPLGLDSLDAATRDTEMQHPEFKGEVAQLGLASPESAIMTQSPTDHDRKYTVPTTPNVQTGDRDFHLGERGQKFAASKRCRQAGGDANTSGCYTPMEEAI